MKGVDRLGGRTTALLAVGALLAGCAAPPSPPAQPTPGAPRAPEARDNRLPPIPAVRGPLELRVSYPPDSGFVATRGENFIFGSAGDGRARVWIDDREVDVQPNGAFLAYLPVPSDGVYELRATLGAQTATLEVPVRLPPPDPAPEAGAQILAGSIYPRGGWAVRPGTRIEVGFRGTPGGSAWLVLPDGQRIPLPADRGSDRAGATDFEVAPGQGGGGQARRPYATYSGFFTARRILSPDSATAWPGLTGESRPSLPLRTVSDRRERQAGAPAGEAAPVGRPLGAPAAGARGAAGAVPAPGGEVRAGVATLVLTVDGQTVRRPLPLNLVLVNPDRPRVGVAADPDPPERNGDDHVNARPGPGGGPYHYTWRNGTELELVEERDGIYRVRLTDELSAYTPSGDIDLLPPGTPPPASRVSTVRMDPQPGYIDVHVALTRRLPYAIEEGDRSLSLLVYGATSRANFLQHGRTDPYLVRGEWRQPTDRLFRLDLHLADVPWGYETFWSGSDLVLRLNRPPAIDPARPLQGLTVGVDPGHGGALPSAMGPTGLTEADANLGISLVLRDALEAAGARVVMSRETDATLSLVERTELARREDVDLWVSVHNNAFPDGVNPFENNGTSVYYNHPRAASLAWAVHEELLDELGLRDLGVGRADFHQPRFTWAPAILTETSFMMVPDHEAFLRSDEGRRRIAAAHLRGLEAWLREVAEQRR